MRAVAVRLLVAAAVILAAAGTAAAAEADPPGTSTTVVTVPASTQGASGKGIVGWLWKELTDEASLTVGYGVMKWALDIQRTSDGATARLVQRDSSSLYASYGTKPFFFESSNFGYTVMVNYHEFDMTRQETANDQFADFGTEVKGYVVYAVPTLYYQWGDHRRTGRFIRLGIGAGVGAARFSGTVRLSTGEVISTTQHDLEPRLALSNFLIARWDHIGLQFSYASPRVYGEGYDVKVADASLYATYTFNF